MALMPRLEIRQSQSLALTPQLMQSIKLLQLSHLEINNFVEEELLRNPMLERDENFEQDPNQETKQEQPPIADLVDQGKQLPSANDVATDLDIDVTSLYPEQVGQDSIAASTRLPTSQNSTVASGEYSDIEQYVAAKITLSEHLSEQVCLLVDEPVDRLIARNLIDNLDDAGYLASDTQAIAEQLGTVVQRVETVLKKVQKADPAGVFACDLKECLSLQLAEKNRLDPMMGALLENLDLVASSSFDKLKQEIGASAEDLRDMLEEIRDLNPRPGRIFDGSPMQAVVPDIYVREGPDGGWLLELNSEILPKVLVNRTYYASISKKAKDGKDKAFLVDCFQTANWLTKSLDQRAQTILKVATEIARMQDSFLLHGVTHLVPMTLKNVADAIEMHESTVSRVTTNKYIATPRGLFEMKYFFTTAISSSAGESDHSAESVRHFLKQLIDTETLEAILSDDIIADMLAKSHKIDIARRTVAKYREAMNIPSSVVRRRQKKAALSGL